MLSIARKHWHRKVGLVVAAFYLLAVAAPAAAVSLSVDPSHCLDEIQAVASHHHSADHADHHHSPPADPPRDQNQNCCGLFGVTAIAPNFAITVIPMGRCQQHNDYSLGKPVRAGFRPHRSTAEIPAVSLSLRAGALPCALHQCQTDEGFGMSPNLRWAWVTATRRATHCALLISAALIIQGCAANSAAAIDGARPCRSGRSCPGDVLSLGAPEPARSPTDRAVPLVGRRSVPI